MELPKHKKIILFDGVCNLCDNFVHFVIKNDSKNIFLFVSQQSDLGKQILKQFIYSSAYLDSVVLYDVESGVFSIKSKALDIILKDIQKLSFITLVLKFLPLFIGDYFYDLVAKNRYLLFGKKETCLIPSEDITSKFLS